MEREGQRQRERGTKTERDVERERERGTEIERERGDLVILELEKYKVDGSQDKQIMKKMKSRVFSSVPNRGKPLRETLKEDLLSLSRRERRPSPLLDDIFIFSEALRQMGLYSELVWE